ncbi:hypothetical protein DB330_04640 [Lacticaseibacillus casei]|nr:hypothetical protein [Lacticaseibacillus casei]PTU97435.1 hypothetical protein DB330_04640 [Lacticaseibacillus casei]PTU99203.1 hypothetical protein DB326_04610 [Lacticaseibacillus casei]HAJ56060.1 hypothetical protein [Lactobacillus sp.]
MVRNDNRVILAKNQSLVVKTPMSLGIGVFAWQKSEADHDWRNATKICADFDKNNLQLPQN